MPSTRRALKYIGHHEHDENLGAMSAAGYQEGADHFPPSLTVDERRQAVYASLVRFASESGPLRERAIHRAILGSLLGSSLQKPLTIGGIRRNMMFGSESVSLRTEVIQQALVDLINQGKADKTTLREKHAYYITVKGQKELDGLVVSVVDLFASVTEPLFRDLDPEIDKDIASGVFRRFACECFGRFGRHIAQTVLGTLKREELLARTDARSAFLAASEGLGMSTSQLESLEVRCQRFLISGEECDERLKLYLTQGFYFTQLLGLDGSAFDPIAEDAFRGAVFYLDTNVLLLGFLQAHDDAHEFAEVVAVAKRLGIELRTTKATIDEMQQVVRDRISRITQIAEVVPDELVKQSNDQVLKAFWNSYESNRTLTPETFFAPLLVPDLQLDEKWGVGVDSISTKEMIAGRDTAEIARCIDEEAKNSRGWGKVGDVLEHDVAHYMLVRDKRVANRKVWFLTRDRSLPLVAATLQPDQPSFCFSHLALLQSISPFINTDAEEKSLADIMSAFITDQIRPLRSLFDISELAIMAEFHADVMATPGDQLVLAFDYVKSSTLKGHQYLQQDIPRVSLALRKFMSSDKDKQLLSLQAERERALQDAMKENELRNEAEKRVLQANLRSDELEDQLAKLNTDYKGTVDQVEELRRDAAARTEREVLNRISSLRKQAIGWSIGSLVLLMLSEEIAARLVESIPWLWPSALHNFVVSVMRISSALMIVWPWSRFIRETRWSEGVRMTALVIVAVVAIPIARIVSPSTMNELADRVEVATLIAAVIGAVWLAKHKKG